VIGEPQLANSRLSIFFSLPLQLVVVQINGSKTNNPSRLPKGYFVTIARLLNNLPWLFGQFGAKLKW